ncbi:MAG: DUF2334 domain-containing protein [candidate division KSB1 bacterium]|nr:DUF2334 domain-containing protein [candidate division KSB1 bacterium]
MSLFGDGNNLCTVQGKGQTRFALATMVLLTACHAALSVAADSLVFVIRVDDVMSRNTTVLPRSIVPFAEAVEARGGRVTWAVIPHRLVEPENRDGNLCRELRASHAAGHEIAQHGYNHICPVCGQFHEFHCPTRGVSLTYAQQDSLIREGIRLLQDSLGVVPLTFVPPSHVADSTTYQVLCDRGFRWVSTTGRPFEQVRGPLVNLGVDFDYTWNLKPQEYRAKLAAALSAVRDAKDSRGYYCMLFHDYFVRAGYENGLVIQWVGELLDSLNAAYGGRVRYMTLSQAGEHFCSAPSKVELAEGNRPGPVALSVFPNPFGLQTTVVLHLASDSVVRLTVFDVIGRVVEQVGEGSFHPGAYSISWTPTPGLPSGVYFLHAQGNGWISVQRCILRK